MTDSRLEVVKYWQHQAARASEMALFYMTCDDRNDNDLEWAVINQQLARDYAQLVFVKRGLLDLIL